MSWYGTKNRDSNFGGDSSRDHLGLPNTTGNITGDNAVFDPFPPSQRQIYNWNDAVDDQEPEPEHEPESAEDRHDSYLLTQELQQHRSRLHRIMESESSSRFFVPQPVLGKRTTEAGYASSATSKISADDALRQKKRKLLEMDDWTGAKALKPLEIQFPQYDKDAPVWGWGEAGTAYPSQPRASQKLPPSSDTFSVKRYPLPKQASLGHGYQQQGEKDIGQSGQLWDGMHGQTMSPGPHDALPFATSSDRGKGHLSGVSRTRPIGRLSGSVNSGQSPLSLLPASLSTFGYERPSIRDKPPRSSNLLASSSQRWRSQTSPYIVEKQFSTLNSSGRSHVPTPSRTSACQQSVVSGTLSEVEQQRFESEGLAILSPSAPAISASVPSAPSISISVTSNRQGTPVSIQQTHKSHHPSPSASQEVPEQESPNQETFDQEAPVQDTPEQETPSRENPDQEALGHKASEKETPDQGAPDQEPPLEMFPAKLPRAVLPKVEVYDVDEASPRTKTVPVVPKEWSTRNTGVVKNSNGSLRGGTNGGADQDGHEAGLFEANRVNIRAIPDWDDGEDPIEDSEESEREVVRRVAAKGKAKKQPDRRKPRKSAASRREV